MRVAVCIDCGIQWVDGARKTSGRGRVKRCRACTTKRSALSRATSPRCDHCGACCRTAVCRHCGWQQQKATKG